MNRKIAIVSILIILILVTVYWFYKYLNNDKKEITVQSEHSDYLGEKPINEKSLEDSSPAEMGSDAELVRLKKLAIEKGANPKLAERIYNYSQAFKLPIHFNGKVVDQKSNPVVGAEIVYNFIVLPGFSPPSRKTIHTDSGGMFSIDNIKGVKLSILSINKEGYECNNFDEGRIDFNHDDVNPDRRLSKYTPSNPYKYECWKFGKKSSAYSNKGVVDIVPDWQNHSITFGPSNIIVHKGIMHDSHLLVRLRVIPSKESKFRGDWDVYVAPVSGGVIQTEDKYMYLAPRDGYSQSWEQNYRRGKKGFKYIEKKNFYIFFTKKSEYGKLAIEFNPYRRKGSRLYIEYTINPDGSRDLQ